MEIAVINILLKEKKTHFISHSHQPCETNTSNNMVDCVKSKIYDLLHPKCLAPGTFIVFEYLLFYVLSLIHMGYLLQPRQWFLIAREFQIATHVTQ